MDRPDVQIRIGASGKDATREFSDIRKSARAAAAGIVRDFIAPVASIAALKAGVLDSIRAFAQYEQIQVRVQQAGVRNIGALNDWARSLSLTTAVQKDFILNQTAITKSLGSSEEQAKLFTEASIAAGAAIGRNWLEIQNQLNKTLGGTLGELAELVPEMKALTAEQLKAGDGARFLIERFGGAAEAQKNTLTGSMQAVKNAAHDLQVELGGLFTRLPGGEAFSLGGIETRLRILEEWASGVNRGAPIQGLDYTPPVPPGPGEGMSAASAIQTSLYGRVAAIPPDTPIPVVLVGAGDGFSPEFGPYTSPRQRAAAAASEILAGTGPSPVDDGPMRDQMAAWERMAEIQRNHWDQMSARAQMYGNYAEEAWNAAIGGVDSFMAYVRRMAMQMIGQQIGSAVASAFMPGAGIGLPGIGVLPGVGLLGGAGGSIGTTDNNPTLNSSAQTMNMALRKRSYRGF